MAEHEFQCRSPFLIQHKYGWIADMQAEIQISYDPALAQPLITIYIF